MKEILWIDAGSWKELELRKKKSTRSLKKWWKMWLRERLTNLWCLYTIYKCTYIYIFDLSLLKLFPTAVRTFFSCVPPFYTIWSFSIFSSFQIVHTHFIMMMWHELINWARFFFFSLKRVWKWIYSIYTTKRQSD